jgi:bifunctional non-homologous end joining protein LigD
VSPDLPLGYRVTTRSGRDITESLPEAAAAVGPGVELVIDGEVVAGAGRADDFYLLAGALARRGRPSGTLTVVAFDLLWVDGHDITGLPWVQRRRLLEQLHFGEHMVATSVLALHDPAALLTACEQLGVEGLMWKRRAAPYEAGRRSSSWRKMKCATWAQVHGPRRIPRR